jgi:GH24 family phage-related lysozyme (muramidase)
MTYSLKFKIDTWLKLGTGQGSDLPDDQRQFIEAGTVLPLSSLERSGDNHLKVALGKNGEGQQLFYKGRNTWYVYEPAVELLKVMSVPVQPSGYAARFKIDTWLKLSTAQGDQLSEDQRQFINAGTELPIAGYKQEGTHLKLTLGKDGQGQQVFYKGRNTWYVYAPAIELLKDGKPFTPDDTSTKPGKTNAKGLRLIKAFEGLRLNAYLDAVGVWTIGYGTTQGVQPGMRITEAQAEALLRKDLDRFEAAVNRLVKVPLNEDQFAALVAFTYNVGEGALETSTLLQLLNRRDIGGAADQFLRWDKGGGRTLAGLTRRRRAERALFLGENYTRFL